MRPLFFGGRRVNLEGLRDIEEIFTWVDRGGLGRAGNPPDRPEKLSFWERCSEQGPNGWTKRADLHIC